MWLFIAALVVAWAEAVALVLRGERRRGQRVGMAVAYEDEDGVQVLTDPGPDAEALAELEARRRGTLPEVAGRYVPVTVWRVTP